MKLRLLLYYFLLFSSISIASENTNSKEKNTSAVEGNLVMPTIVIDNVTISESDGTVIVPIYINAPDSVDTVISITTTDGTAISPNDYATFTSTVTIPSGQTSANISIPIIDDNTSEPTEEFTVNGTVVSGNTVNTVDSATVTIIDNDDSIVSINDVTVQEEDGVASVPIIMNGLSAVDTVIQVTTVDNSATDPSDYTNTTVMVTIPAFQSAVSVSIPITDDTFGEPTEDFNLNGTVLSGNTLNATASGTITIGQNDTPGLRIADVTVAENTPSVQVAVSITNPSAFDTSIDITTVDDSATNPSDYTTTTLMVTIPSGQTMVNISIPIIDDDVFEPMEGFNVNGVVLTGNTNNPSDSGTVTIIDDGSCGGATVGEPCDDGDPLTLSDFIDANCNCIGEATNDLDGDGISNSQEVLNFTDYNDSCDPVQNAGYTGFDSDNEIWQEANCDNDDLNNALEIIVGTDPYDMNYNTIEGTMTYDINNDGCNGTDDLIFPYTRINITNGTNTVAVFTNSTGNYSYDITTTGSFTVTPDLENPTFFNATPATATTNFFNTNNNVSNQDFCITSNGVNLDVEIIIAPIGVARPGFDATYQLTYKNNGNQTVSGAIDFTYDDAILDFISSTQTPSSQTTGTVNWNYTDLAPFETRSISVTLNVNGPTETPAVNLGDQLLYLATITPISGDVLPADNQFSYTQIVVGSYDPNDITCVEGDFVNPDDIGKDLHYIINFENTGTFFAENIVVEMQIDPAQFDINTLRLLSASHEAIVRIKDDMIRFIFQNILLQPDGQGNILIKMKTQNTLVENDIVSNQASIFFDYNFPIVTNNAQTTFSVLSTQEFQADSSITLYPNPTKNNIYITANNNIKSIVLYDMQGRILVSEKHNNNTVNLDVSNQAQGVYFVKINTEKGVNTEKIIKM